MSSSWMKMISLTKLAILAVVRVFTGIHSSRKLVTVDNTEVNGEVIKENQLGKDLELSSIQMDQSIRE